MESSQSQVTAAAMTNGGIGQECSLRSRLSKTNDEFCMGDSSMGHHHHSNVASVSLNGKLDQISSILLSSGQQQQQPSSPQNNNTAASAAAGGDGRQSSVMNNVHVHVLDNNKVKEPVSVSAETVSGAGDNNLENLRKRNAAAAVAATAAVPNNNEKSGQKVTENEMMKNNNFNVNGSAKQKQKQQKPKTEEEEGEFDDDDDDETELLRDGKTAGNNRIKKMSGGGGDNGGGDESCGLNIFNSCQTQQLLRLADMPAHLQFNKFVHTGYRRLHDFWGCFCSLFYLHNETVNIFTHVIPIVWVLTNWRSMYPWDEIRGNLFLNVLGWSHVIASISPWLGSVLYHLFMNHEKGVRFYHLLLQMDMFGIWVTECFGALTNLSASTWCLPANFQTIIIVLYAVGSVWGLQKAMTAWTPLGRRMCFAPVFITRILGFFLRISRYGGGEPNILLHVILQDAVSLIGGMIGVIRIPEKWFPGKLDLFCNSHHIMHVLVVLAVFHMNIATNGDVKWMIKHWEGCPEV